MDNDELTSKETETAALHRSSIPAPKSLRVTTASESLTIARSPPPSANVFQGANRYPDSGRTRSLTEALSPPAKHRRVAEAVGLEEPAVERPEKRARLEKNHELLTSGTIGLRHITSSHQHEYASHTTHRAPTMASRSTDPQDQDTRSPCTNCGGSDDCVAVIVRDLLRLQGEISKLHQADRARQQSFETVAHEVTKQGLLSSLGWTAQEIRTCTSLIQGIFATPRTGLPSLAEAVPEAHTSERQRARISSLSSSVATTRDEPWRVPILSEVPKVDDYYQRAGKTWKEPLSSIYDPALPPIPTSHEMKRSQNYEYLPPGSAQSPHPSSTSSVFGSAPSPMQSQSFTKALPSPPSSQYPLSSISGPSQYSPTTVQSAQNSHMQDLQHQISTKTLALQTLQREHDQLLAAFSRSQIRCNTLDKKSQVSDHEINTLTEERIRLQQQVVSLELQVEELIKTRDEATKQSSADGAQWRQIMAMSSQLQMKGAEEARRFKLERDAWDEDRLNLQKRIEELETGKVGPIPAGQSSEMSNSGAPDDVLRSSSVDVLRQEILRLRQSRADLELTVQEMGGEAEQIDSALMAMANIRKRIESTKRRGENS